MSQGCSEENSQSIAAAIQAFEDGWALRHIRSYACDARGLSFVLHVCRFLQGGQLRVWVTRDGLVLGSIYDPAHDITCLPDSPEESALVQELLHQARQDIEQNPLALY